MKTKLTLWLDHALIEEAKSYGRSHGKSVSQLVADYFILLGQNGQELEDRLPPLTRSLLGVAVDAEPAVNEYKEHLRRK